MKRVCLVCLSSGICDPLEEKLKRQEKSYDQWTTQEKLRDAAIAHHRYQARQLARKIHEEQMRMFVRKDYG